MYTRTIFKVRKTAKMNLAGVKMHLHVIENILNIEFSVKMTCNCKTVLNVNRWQRNLHTVKFLLRDQRSLRIKGRLMQQKCTV